MRRDYKKLQQNKKILVTGSAGFIGYHLSKALLEYGCHVIGLDNKYSYFQFIRGDLSNKQKNGFGHIYNFFKSCKDFLILIVY